MEMLHQLHLGALVMPLIVSMVVVAVYHYLFHK